MKPKSEFLQTPEDWEELLGLPPLDESVSKKERQHFERHQKMVEKFQETRRSAREAVELKPGEALEFEKKGERDYLKEKHLYHEIKFENEEVMIPTRGLVTDVGRDKKGNYLVVLYQDAAGFHPTRVYSDQFLADFGLAKNNGIKQNKNVVDLGKKENHKPENRRAA